MVLLPYMYGSERNRSFTPFDTVTVRKFLFYSDIHELLPYC